LNYNLDLKNKNMEDINSSTGTVTSGHSALGANTFNTTGTSTLNNCNHPQRIEVREVGETIEMIYKQTSLFSRTGALFSRTGGLPPYHDERLYKIVYSCVDGKWNKSEPIFGKIIPAQGESYQFED
jgi:hypothetical protein